ncbi:MAG: hypothetical protein CMJ35_09970 [Phycisphaerae bacterium]|nr:hypothetical protein [Phycisphaerae bacterium]MBM91922.1 hypothetical protein [Phycisphaerae bacterium]HCT45785.1 hypothetical protein [Phycisphaerales bacterium]|tara:strand:+ start:456 stop:1064 length:609 start_codon:yes stop_codon:yes gene_type:complete
MKYHATLFLICGSASLAGAQDFSLSIVSAPSTVDSTGGASFTMSVVGDASVGQFYSAAAFSLVSDSPLITNIDWAFANWPNFPIDGSYAGDGNYSQIIAGALWGCGAPPPFCAPTEDARLGETIGVFTVHLAEGVSGQVDFELLVGDPFSLEVINWDTGELWNDTQGTLTLNGTTVNVVPAPGAATALGLLGLMMPGSRRRR